MGQTFEGFKDVWTKYVHLLSCILLSYHVFYIDLKLLCALELHQYFWQQEFQ